MSTNADPADMHTDAHPADREFLRRMAQHLDASSETAVNHVSMHPDVAALAMDVAAHHSGQLVQAERLMRQMGQHADGGRAADKPYGDVTYADPGYQGDGKKRYPLDTPEHCRAAWSYINQADNAGKYTAEQLKAIKSRIKAAAERHGIDIADGRAATFNDLHPRAPKDTTTGGEFVTAKSSGKAKATGHGTPPHPAKPHPAGKPPHATHPSGSMAYDPDANTGPGYGMKGGDPRVHKLQQALNRLGIADDRGKTLADDGKLGPRTTAALKAAQKRLGLKPDGVVTPTLLDKLAGLKSLRSADLSLCVRDFEFALAETRDGTGDGRTLEGYAAVYDTPARIRDLQGDFDETIKRGAFARSLKTRTPLLQWDHGKDPSIGSVPIGAFEEIREDAKGLYVRASLFDNPAVERIRQAIAGRAVRGMSFRFEVPKGGEVWPAHDAREIRDADVFELGPVAFPAYDSTSVSVRSLLAQLDATERRSLIRELAGYLSEAADLTLPDDGDTDFTGRSDARSDDGGDTPGTAPGNGDGPPAQPVMYLRQRLDDGALRARGILR